MLWRIIRITNKFLFLDIPAVSLFHQLFSPFWKLSFISLIINKNSVQVTVKTYFFHMSFWFWKHFLLVYMYLPGIWYNGHQNRTILSVFVHYASFEVVPVHHHLSFPLEFHSPWLTHRIHLELILVLINKLAFQLSWVFYILKKIIIFFVLMIYISFSYFHIQIW